MDRKEINRYANLIRKQGKAKFLSNLPLASRGKARKEEVMEDYYFELIDYHYQHKRHARKKAHLKSFLHVLQELHVLEREINYKFMSWRGTYPESMERFQNASFLERRKIARKNRNRMYSAKLKEWVVRQQAIINENADSIHYIFGEDIGLKKLVTFIKVGGTIFFILFFAASIYAAFNANLG